IEQLKDRRQALIEKNLEGTYPDEIFREQLDIIERQIAEAHAVLKQKQLKSYDIELLCAFVKNKLAKPRKAYEDADLKAKKFLLSSIYPQGIKWMYPGLSNTDISLQYQQIKGIARS